MSYWYQKFVDSFFEKQGVVNRMSDSLLQRDVTFGPFIAVSRDPGSGGKPIAELVAKKLGFTFYNKKLIHEIAKSSNTRDDIMQDIDEKARTMIDDLVHNILNPEYVSEQRYFKYLCKVMLTLAQKGKAVFLGRGSNFITPRAYGLHVRVTAPYRVCVARAVQYEKIPYLRAREKVGKTMTERADFVKEYFGKDIVNPKYYDLTINTTYYSIEAASELVINAFKLKFPNFH